LASPVLACVVAQPVTNGTAKMNAQKAANENRNR